MFFAQYIVVCKITTSRWVLENVPIKNLLSGSFKILLALLPTTELLTRK